jgi:NhaA family Na+:H+ antiporter
MMAFMEGKLSKRGMVGPGWQPRRLESTFAPMSKSGSGRRHLPRAKRPLVDLATPFERFITQQVSASWLLFGAAIAALVWANSPWAHTYAELWHMEVGLHTGKFYLDQPLHLWINDGLMAVFFFVIGLEIKREVLTGELSEPSKAILPVIAAVGGMVVPVGLFMLFNPDPAGEQGWGIPMATDIAFTLGILQVLGKKVPINLKVFLTAFAIVDDLGAVAVIAIFYSHGLDAGMLVASASILVFLGMLSWQGYYNKYFYFACAVVVWVLFLNGGLHPTLAGVLMAFTIPIRKAIRLPEFLEKAEDALDRLRDGLTGRQKAAAKLRRGFPLLTKEQLIALDDLESMTDDVLSPLQHLEHKLNGYLGYIIMPIFALANAGVALSLGDGSHNGLILTIALSMVLGKFLGIAGFSLAAVRLGICTLPQGVTTRHLLGASLLGGLGFTMALFIAGLAFPDLNTLGGAKLGILIGSVLAGAGGYLILRGAAEDKQPLSARAVATGEYGSTSRGRQADPDTDADQGPGKGPDQGSGTGGGLAIGKTVYPRR